MTTILAALILGGIVICGLLIGYAIGRHDTRTAMIETLDHEMREGRVTLMWVHDFFAHFDAHD